MYELVNFQTNSEIRKKTVQLNSSTDTRTTAQTLRNQPTNQPEPQPTTTRTNHTERKNRHGIRKNKKQEIPTNNKNHPYLLT